MSSENTLTGRNGHFSFDGQAVARATSWDVSKKLVGGSEWGDSDSAGYTNRTAGRKDATFNSAGKFDTADEVWDIFQPEDIVAALLYLNTSALFWNFPRALNQDFNMSVNIDTQEVIGWTAAWGADGIFYYPGEAA